MEAELGTSFLSLLTGSGKEFVLLAAVIYLFWRSQTAMVNTLNAHVEKALNKFEDLNKSVEAMAASMEKQARYSRRLERKLEIIQADDEEEPPRPRKVKSHIQ